MKNENKNSEERAFPFLTSDDCGDFGITKREYFAGFAMQGLLAHDHTVLWNKEKLCEQSIFHADELLKQLSESK